jgi:hypothetical protein
VECIVYVPRKDFVEHENLFEKGNLFWIGLTEGRSAAKGNDREVNSCQRRRRRTIEARALVPFVGLQRQVMPPWV